MNFIKLILSLALFVPLMSAVQAQGTQAALRGSANNNPEGRRLVKKNKWYVAGKLARNLMNSCDKKKKYETMKGAATAIKVEASKFSEDIAGYAPNTDLSVVLERFVDFLDEVGDNAIEAVSTCWAAKALLAGAFGVVNTALVDGLSAASEIDLPNQQATIRNIGRAEMNDFTKGALDSAKGFLQAIENKGTNGISRSTQADQQKALLAMVTAWRDVVAHMKGAVQEFGGDHTGWKQLNLILTDYLAQVKEIM